MISATGATIQTLAGVVVVTAAALAVGFRPRANAADWLAALGVVLLLTFANATRIPDLTCADG